MSVDLLKIADLGIIYFVVAVAMVKLWPWFKDEYWPQREARWLANFEATQKREQLLMEQSSAFLVALESYQDGFAARNSEQHEAILHQLELLNDKIMQS